MIDRYKIHRIVEYIRQSDFGYEMFEVIHDTERILAHYDLIDIELTQDEYLLLMVELLPLAEQFEFREAEYLAFQDELFFEQQRAVFC